jgi:hypothetical protein
MNEEFTIAAIFNRTKYRFIVYLCAKILTIQLAGIGLMPVFFAWA